jgi:hypothetical protein
MQSKRERRSSRTNAEATRKAQLAALRVESDQELLELIARLLATPMHERTQFLRRRLPGGGSAL